MIKSISKRLLHIGQQFPATMATFVFGHKGKYQDYQNLETTQFLQDKKVVLVGFQGEFIPQGTEMYLPDYVKLHKEFQKKECLVLVLTVDSPEKCQELGERFGGNLIFLADENAKISQELNAAADLTERGFGLKTKRFSALLEKGTITKLNEEIGTGMTKTSKALTILQEL